MAVKTITLDLKTYEALRRLKRADQSLSDVVRERLGAKSTARDLLEAVRGVKISDETLNAIDRQIAQRRRSPARSPRL